MPASILKYASIIALFYIVLLVLLSYTSFENNVFSAVQNLITVPITMFIFGCFLFSIFKIMRRKSIYKSIAIMNAVSIILVMVFSIIR